MPCCIVHRPWIFKVVRVIQVGFCGHHVLGAGGTGFVTVTTVSHQVGQQLIRVEALLPNQLPVLVEGFLPVALFALTLWEVCPPLFKVC
ncbi:hypothetical protein [Endozoicomonas sp.]|uniref:hypothetical protein n=1 Tax=Endozoicomonas sp. TaxID=1892382 RepID=UPI003AF76481